MIPTNVQDIISIRGTTVFLEIGNQSFRFACAGDEDDDDSDGVVIWYAQRLGEALDKFKDAIRQEAICEAIDIVNEFADYDTSRDSRPIAREIQSRMLSSSIGGSTDDE